jgi:hypothetical protein
VFFALHLGLALGSGLEEGEKRGAVQLLVDYIAHYRDYHRIVVINPQPNGSLAVTFHLSRAVFQDFYTQKIIE